MPTLTPYRLQIFLSEPMRQALHEAAHNERTSIQKLVVAWLTEKLDEYPEARKYLEEAQAS